MNKHTDVEGDHWLFLCEAMKECIYFIFFNIRYNGHVVKYCQRVYIEGICGDYAHLVCVGQCNLMESDEHQRYEEVHRSKAVD